MGLGCKMHDSVNGMRVEQTRNFAFIANVHCGESDPARVEQPADVVGGARVGQRIDDHD